MILFSPLTPFLLLLQSHWETPIGDLLASFIALLNGIGTLCHSDSSETSWCARITSLIRLCSFRIQPTIFSAFRDWDC